MYENHYCKLKSYMPIENVYKTEQSWNYSKTYIVMKWWQFCKKVQDAKSQMLMEKTSEANGDHAGLHFTNHHQNSIISKWWYDVKINKMSNGDKAD